MKRISSKLRWLVVVGLLAVLVLLLVARPTPDKPLSPVSIRRPPYAHPVVIPPFLYTVLPRSPSWAWVWRLKEKVFGKLKAVGLVTELYGLTNSISDIVSNNPALSPNHFAEESGLSVWLLSSAELASLRGHFRTNLHEGVLLGGGITTGEGTEVRLTTGNSGPRGVGLDLDYMPRLRPNVIDLTAIIRATENVTNDGTTTLRTNLDVLTRLQIPKGGGAFILDGGPRASEQMTGILIIAR